MAKPQFQKAVVTPSDDTLFKRMTAERGVVDELLLVCGVIGTTYNDGDELVPVTDCLNWLQDLQRALRRDDDTFRPISLLEQMEGSATKTTAPGHDLPIRYSHWYSPF
jgi:hypothetical protein